MVHREVNVELDNQAFARHISIHKYTLIIYSIITNDIDMQITVKVESISRKFAQDPIENPFGNEENNMQSFTFQFEIMSWR